VSERAGDLALKSGINYVYIGDAPVCRAETIRSTGLLLRENAVRLFKIFYRRYANVLQGQNSGRREAITAIVCTMMSNFMEYGGG